MTNFAQSSPPASRHGTLWIDTEFNGWGGELISLALVDEHGREFYEALRCDNPEPWVAAHVLPVVGSKPVSLGILQLRLHYWLTAYDTVHVVADWPDDIAYFCRALITGPGKRMDSPALTMEIRRDLDAVSECPHNALADARAMRARHLQLMAAGAPSFMRSIARRLVDLPNYDKAAEAAIAGGGA